jgi:hypothetical protein
VLYKETRRLKSSLSIIHETVQKNMKIGLRKKNLEKFTPIKKNYKEER